MKKEMHNSAKLKITWHPQIFIKSDRCVPVTPGNGAAIKSNKLKTVWVTMALIMRPCFSTLQRKP